jgi:oligoribonuclease NrnB/cAMP/cGMP phosphodiesterase (DHH superfamily)
MDGSGAAWAAWSYFRNNSKFIGVQYDKPMPHFNAGDDLYILDFSYSPEAIITAAQHANSITLIDHHQSAQKEHELYWATHNTPENVKISFDLNHSGCVLAWQYFFPDKPVPDLLNIIEDHDLWRFKYPSTKAIMCALHNKTPFKIQNLHKLYGGASLKNIEKMGDLLLEQRNGSIKRLLVKKHPIQLGDYIGLGVNAPPEFSNELGHALAHESNTFGTTYQYDGDTQRWWFAIRSTGDYDVSEVAKQYGGGGHKNAAGFSLDQDHFKTLFRSTKLPVKNE